MAPTSTPEARTRDRRKLVDGGPILVNDMPTMPFAVLLAFGVSLVSGATAAAQPAPHPRVVIDTEAGQIEVELDATRAPRTAANFLRYVDEQFFDGTSFYRTVTPGNQPDNLVKIAVIQGGADGTRAAHDPHRARTHLGHRGQTPGRRSVDGQEQSRLGHQRVLHLRRRSARARFRWSPQPGWPGLCRLWPGRQRPGHRQAHPRAAGRPAAVGPAGRHSPNPSRGIGRPLTARKPEVLFAVRSQVAH